MKKMEGEHVDARYNCIYFFRLSAKLIMARSITAELFSPVIFFSRFKIICALREIMAEIIFFPCDFCRSFHLRCRSRSDCRLSFSVAMEIHFVMGDVISSALIIR